jgi:hypothetical protein
MRSTARSQACVFHEKSQTMSQPMPQPLPPPERSGADMDDERLRKLRRLHDELTQLNAQLEYLHLMLRLKGGTGR